MFAVAAVGGAGPDACAAVSFPRVRQVWQGGGVGGGLFLEARPADVARGERC